MDCASIYHNLFTVYQSVAPATQLSGKNVLKFKWRWQSYAFHQINEEYSRLPELSKFIFARTDLA
ncbi:hypothetical protein M5D96_009346 [Drosophila gunungcola]|uniref:Uncharacterized protein n=1 Tax=Drosophila gunungcola TaxID=103775 RepID=A0A9P9YJC1_9MUSC|nr:hypothetical protein M5D96_009346 [Drosophila gunungcola]